MNAVTADDPPMARVRHVLRRVLREARRWGLPGAAGTVLVAGGVFLAAVGLPRGRAALQADEQALHDARLRAAQALQRRAAQDVAADPAERFLAAFPAAGERHRRLTNLLALAAGMGLQPRRSEVRSLPEAELGMTRVRLVLPLSGPYEGLRAYVDQALRDDPALSLDLLRIERSDAQAGELRAELQWSLWMRADPAADRAGPGTPR